MRAGDSFLSVMAAYTLGEAGDNSGTQFLEKLVQRSSNMFPSIFESPDLRFFEEVLKILDTIDITFAFYNRSYFIEAKAKLLKMLEIYSVSPPKMNIRHFDDLVAFSVKKTRGFILDGLAVCDFNLGNIDDSLQQIMEAITIAGEVEDPKLLKITYNDLGVMHMSLGNYYSALELLHKSLEIEDSSHDPWRKRNRTVANLALLYYQIGQYDKAFRYSQEALELSEKEGDPYGTARCLNASGVILCSLNEFEDAEEYLQRALDRSDELQDKALRGLILNNLAYLYFSLSYTDKARNCLENALDLAIKMSDVSTESLVLLSLAMIEIEAGNIDFAVGYAQSALSICKDTYNLAGQSDAHYVLGSIEDYAYDNPSAAYEFYREAIDISESLRKNLLLDDFKISFAGNHIAFYQQMTALCIRMDRTEEAFEYIERAKSRTFVDMLSSTSNTIEARTLTTEQIQEITNLKGRLDLLRKQISAAISRVDKDASDVRREDIEAEISDLESEYLRTFDDLKMKDPEWMSLVSVEVADITVVQSGLDEKTALLDFYQTGENLLAIVIKKNKPPSTLRIPVDIEVEAERLFNLFMSLSKGSSIDCRTHEFIKDIKKPLSYFHDLLIRSIQELIQDCEHLIVIPHNFWHYLPFHALYDKGSEQYLIDKFSVSYAPSATALNLCCKESRGEYKTALILANPSNDLTHAEEEAEDIRTRFGDGGYAFKRELATLERFSDHRGTDVIHLACHGYFRGDEALFSHLILADAEGKAAPLFLPDIFNLRLKASLVTLSACETGLSQFTAGDELIGISRAFFYAGTPALLTSLWAVNDKSTAFLMERFYEALTVEGLSKAEALRSAMLKIKAMPEYRHPYVWAPFFLSGDWR